MSVTKESFRDWKSNPVTKAVLNEICRRIFDAREHLGANAGIDPLLDRYQVGAIAAYGDLLNIEFDEVTNGN